MAIIAMQFLYLISAFVSSQTTGIQTQYNLQVLLIMLGTMAILALINVLQFFIIPKGKNVYLPVMAVYYISVILFSVCVSNQYRDAVLAILWIVLLATTGILFGRTSYLIGTVVMLLATVFSPIVMNYDYVHVAALAVTITMTVYASYLFYRYREVGLIKMQDYEQLKSRTRKQAQRIQILTNNIRDALVSTSPTGEIQLYNSATMGLLDTNQRINGLGVDKLFKLIDEDGKGVKMSRLLRNATRPVERTDLRLKYKDGQCINLRLNIIPVKNQYLSGGKTEIDNYIIMAADITKQKSLDDERDEFIGVVSHELRTPVAIAEGALSNLQLLIERGGDPKLFASTLDSAHKQILYLGQMVNDLSTLSRAQRGVNMDDDEIDIEELMTSLYNKYNDDANQRGLRLIVDLSLTGTVTVPSMVIEEIMQNLITNAIKYTDSGSVTIGVSPIKDNPNHAKFYVKDTGIGISKSDLEHVFQRFWRSEDYRTRQTNGTGLGLHVVDQLANKIDSKVEVTSKIGVGSTFSIVLPIKATK